MSCLSHPVAWVWPGAASAAQLAYVQAQIYLPLLLASTLTRCCFRCCFCCCLCCCGELALPYSPAEVSSFCLRSRESARNRGRECARNFFVFINEFVLLLLFLCVSVSCCCGCCCVCCCVALQLHNYNNKFRQI